MSLFEMPQLWDALGLSSRLLGLDPGRRTIGIALSDVSLLVASPYASLRRAKLSVNAAEIKRIAVKEGAGGLVCGFPLSLDFSFGPAAQSVRDWALALSDMTSLPAVLWDERLSSSAINRMLVSELDMTRKRRAKVVDKIAASYILQSALDASSFGQASGGRDRV